MLFNNIIIPSTILACLASQAMGASLPSKRQTPATCTRTNVGYLALKPASATGQVPFTYAGIVSGVTRTGIDGNNDSLIVTKDNKGNPLTPQKWEFAQCTNQNNSNYPPEFHAPTNGPSSITFGILRPFNTNQHCLAMDSKQDELTGSKNTIVDSFCTQVPLQFRTFMLVDEIYGDSNDGKNLYFQAQDMTVTIASTSVHAEMQFFNNQTQRGTPMQLVLAPLSSA